jgi:3-isopropylmalate/(R)-2-methylmalate dehydratase large subunit
LVYKAVEFCGDAVKKFTVSERFTLCNMTTEAGAKTAVIAPDQQVYDYLKQQRNIDVEVQDWWFSVVDANYSATITIDLDKLQPQIANNEAE